MVVIDNLVKGAGGQAVQAMNLALGHRGDARAGRWRDLSMLTESQASALLPVYAQFPVRPVRGEGSWIIDVDGQRWLDAYGGHAVASTGHSHPHVVRAIAEQAAQLIFYSTVLPHPNRELLAARIAALMPAGLDRSFFCNSGAEANENALSLARKRTGRELVVSVTGGWHGRTVATLAVHRRGQVRGRCPPGRNAAVTKIPFNDVDALERAIDDVGRGANCGAGAGHVRCARLLARVPAGGARCLHPAWRGAHLR